MGDVRVPALATLLSAFVAVAGSMFVVWRSGRQQQRLQQREFADRARARETQRAEERARAARAAEVDACVQLDAAVAIAVAHLRRVVDLVGRPGVRRRLFGRKWAEHWNRQVTDASIELALPLPQCGSPLAPRYARPSPTWLRGSGTLRTRSALSHSEFPSCCWWARWSGAGADGSKRRSKTCMRPEV